MPSSRIPEEVLIAVLAAGASRRLGQPKQLVPVGGEPLLRRQCRIAIESQIGPVVAVLGCYADTCALAISGLQQAVRRNDSWEEGIASSIREATRAAVELNSAGLLILHCDHYRVSALDLQSLHTAWSETGRSNVCRARHGDYVGPPVIFPAGCFSELLTLQGDKGARGIISVIGSNSLVDVEMPNAIYDLDLPEHLASLVSV
jgi:molybdenum cofactor cytidylyltransferase